VRYGVGTRVRVQVSRVDLDSRKIDFRLVKEWEGGSTQASSASAGRKKPRMLNPEWDGAGSPQDELLEVQRTDREVKRAAKRAAKKVPARSSSGSSPNAAGAKTSTGKASGRKSSRKR